MFGMSSNWYISVKEGSLRDVPPRETTFHIPEGKQRFLALKFPLCKGKDGKLFTTGPVKTKRKEQIHS